MGGPCSHWKNPLPPKGARPIGVLGPSHGSPDCIFRFTINPKEQASCVKDCRPQTEHWEKRWIFVCELAIPYLSRIQDCAFQPEATCLRRAMHLNSIVSVRRNPGQFLSPWGSNTVDAPASEILALERSRFANHHALRVS